MSDLKAMLQAVEKMNEQDLRELLAYIEQLQRVRAEEKSQNASKPAGKRKLGMFKDRGTFWMADDFDAELPDSFWFPDDEDKGA